MSDEKPLSAIFAEVRRDVRDPVRQLSWAFYAMRREIEATLDKAEAPINTPNSTIMENK